ncbi:MAG TPA: hypothetical protein VNK70_01730 [Candidatus Paceibacterota bacterium]|nr:hypothetical protein [Candidatus Paceibacterota bacterium]
MRDWHIAVLEKLPEVPPDKARYLIRHKKELGKLLRQALADARQSFSDVIAEWERFYQKYFGMEVDLSVVRIPDDPGGFERVLLIAADLTPNMVFEVCKSKFPSRKYVEDLDRDVPQNERDPKDGAYAIRVRDRVKADEEFANRSAESIAQEGLKTETLLERMIHELKFFDETGRHLDIRNWTLCSGSRCSDGRVPLVSWAGGGFGVYWYSPRVAGGGWRPHLVVSS